MGKLDKMLAGCALTALAAAGATTVAADDSPALSGLGCVGYLSNGAASTLQYNLEGVRNTSTTTPAELVCPVPYHREYGTQNGAPMWFHAYDGSSTQTVMCYARMKSLTTGSVYTTPPSYTNSAVTNNYPFSPTQIPSYVGYSWVQFHVEADQGPPHYWNYFCRLPQREGASSYSILLSVATSDPN